MLDRKQLTAFSIDFIKGIETAYRRFLGNELRGIITAQSELHGGYGYRVGDMAFFWEEKGPVVTTLQYLPANVLPALLNPLLLPRHEQWMEHFHQHDRDFPRIRQVLGSLAIRAKERQDLRDMFPEHVIQPALQHELIVGLRRSRPDLYAGPPPAADSIDFPGWKFERSVREQQWDPKMVAMYDTVGTMIDTYLGYKFL